MRIEIEIPKEFEGDYENDKFEDFFSRVLYDIGKGFLCGNYERETAGMFINAFKESKVAYDVEAVVAELEKDARKYQEISDYHRLMTNNSHRAEVYESKAEGVRGAISIVRGKE